jgi:SpoVK/Ycf46/Vps4 family AAA+-type ATPase
MQVTIADTKSKWFGESEKLIEGIFNNYRETVEKCRKRKEAIPILLFNEADAVFSKRGDVENGRVSQTQNAMQNIILEELEKLDGILIATTNLTQNLDKAFERRFLYKIEFSAPDREVRRNIWMSAIPEIDAATADQLAADYRFSGGQIENIARKCDVDFILHGGAPTLAVLKRCCDDESLDKSCGKIGFCI